MAEMCRKLENEQENVFPPSAAEENSVTEKEELEKVGLDFPLSIGHSRRSLRCELLFLAYL